MTHGSGLPPQVRWAQMRFAVVGPLLVSEPPTGELRGCLAALASQEWTHPISGLPVRFNVATIERWYYQAKGATMPTMALLRSRRKDAGVQKSMTPEVVSWLAASYRTHARWSFQLHYDNLRQSWPEVERAGLPSYATVRRYMKAQGWRPRRSAADRSTTEGAHQARERLRTHEVRSYEHSHTHALWHIDGHHGSLALSHQGRRERPVLIAVLDDHSRLICHAQWFWSEEARAAVHVLVQAMIKRGLPRMLLSDNGGAYTAPEVREGLHRLGVLSERTLCYSPYQNGKMEVFWAQVEGRLLAMLAQQRDLDLYRLNELTQAWIEQEYHRREHRVIGNTPLGRYLSSPHVGRSIPQMTMVTQAFTRRQTRRQRRSDGSISVEGRPFSIPARYRHLDQLVVRYAIWDLDAIYLTNPDTDAILERLLPVDPHRNAAGIRRQIEAEVPNQSSTADPPPGLPPLLQAALDQTRASGLPPAFLPQCDEHPWTQEPPHAAP